jgi:hypothetical protein
MMDREDNAPASTPPSGEITSRLRRAPRPIIDKRIIAIGFVVASVTAGVILWVTDKLAGKASAGELERVREKHATLEQRLAGLETGIAWIRADLVEVKSVLWRLAAREGVTVPLAPPEAP